MASYEYRESSPSIIVIVATVHVRTLYEIKCTPLELVAKDIRNESSLKFWESRSTISMPTLIVYSYSSSQILSSVFDLEGTDAIATPSEKTVIVKVSDRSLSSNA